MSKNPLFRNGEESEKVIRNTHADPNHHQKLITSRGSPLAHASKVWSTSVSAFVSFCLQHNRTNDRQNDHITSDSVLLSSSLAVIHTIHGRPWMRIARDRAWSVSRCTHYTATDNRDCVQCVALCRPIPAVDRKLVAKCKIQTRVQQLLIAKTDIRWESRFSLPHLHSRPQLGGFLLEYCHAVWYGKTRMVGLPDGEKS